MDFSANRTRVTTGLLLAVVPLLAIAMQGWTLFIILTLFCILAQWEFHGLFKTAGPGLFHKVLAALCTLPLLLSFKLESNTWVLLCLMGGFWAAGMAFLIRYSRNPETTDFRTPMIFLCGLIYIPLNFHFFMNFNRAELFLVLLAAVFTDTAAFYVGTAIGKRKIWPSVSPKKSWAGSLGGLAACMLVTTIMGLSLGNGPVWAWPLLGAALNIAAQMGDFFESALKRALAVKDSGSILPGHGGLLDRVDSLLLVVPVYALLRTIHTFFG
jgi:phosphatidate cytidylyltransferase